MATYFVDASGTSPGGYTNFAGLVAAVTLLDGDIIEVVDNGTIDDSAAVINFTVFGLISVTIRSYASNVSRPTIQTKQNDYGMKICDGYKIQNLKFLKNSMAGTNAPHISVWEAGPSGGEVTGCFFQQTNTAYHTGYAVYVLTNFGTHNFKICNNECVNTGLVSMN